MNNRRRSYRAGEAVVINATAPGAMRVVVERIERGRVWLGWQLPIEWVINMEQECWEAS
jgi:hypothetical protein